MMMMMPNELICLFFLHHVWFNHEVSIKIDDDLEMIVSNLCVPARPVRANRVRTLPSRAVRPDLPALYMEVGHSRAEHCSCCHQNFAAGQLCFGVSFARAMMPRLNMPFYFIVVGHPSVNITNHSVGLLSSSKFVHHD